MAVRNKAIYILGVLMLCMGAVGAYAQSSGAAQINPYKDEKLVHFGFFLGVDMPSYQVDSAASPAYYARAYNVGVGFNVGFITDLRLSRHLNLRFLPGLHFGYTNIRYMPVNETNMGSKKDVPNLTIPLTIPLYLKWSAEREGNYRPYVTVGGGFSIDFNSFADRSNRIILTKPYDGYVGVGLGCDFYFPWFNFTPEIRYEFGFVDALAQPGDKIGGTPWQPSGEMLVNGKTVDTKLFTTSVERMMNQRISIIFNFE